MRSRYCFTDLWDDYFLLAHQNCKNQVFGRIGGHGAKSSPSRRYPSISAYVFIRKRTITPFKYITLHKALPAPVYDVESRTEL